VCSIGLPAENQRLLDVLGPVLADDSGASCEPCKDAVTEKPQQSAPGRYWPGYRGLLCQGASAVGSPAKGGGMSAVDANAATREAALPLGWWTVLPIVWLEAVAWERIVILLAASPVLAMEKVPG